MVNLSIPITDHGDQCVSQYNVMYKLSTETGYTVLPVQFSSPITINNLLEDSIYNVRIIRNCCDGLVSPPLDITVNTGLETPTGFTATPGSTEVTLTWDNMADATNYIIERSTSSDFSTALTEVYNGAHTASVLDSGLSNGTLYYYRIKSQASGYADSDYAYDEATPSA